ncbi:MAG TPA: hypothetical protein VML75_01665 [Kofleriaceae bacterium]|nr:hypothetical protein [Kofleriaceae bacterium]
MLQPATKALAQMLAGRTQVSGQLEQARAVLGQAERLIADRVHNRLNPAEREEFFEQLARLRLTLADAADEAEARAAEEQVPRPPAAPPVAQERLKEMALALATPEGARRRAASGSEEGSADPRSTAAEDEERAPRPLVETAPAPRESPDGLGSAAAEGGEASEAAPQPPDGPRRLLAINKAGRLELPRDVAASASQSLSSPRSRTAVRRRLLSPQPPAAASAAPAEPERAAASDADEHAGNGAGADAEERAKAPRRSRKTKAGLPEGWIIDEEGFVVPGPS